MTNLQTLKYNLIDICKEHSKAKEILKKVNGKRDYVEIANLLKIHRTTCSNILSKAKTFGLLEKGNGFYKKAEEFKHLNIDRVLRDGPLVLPKEEPIRIKKQKKIIKTGDVKKKLHDYFLHHFKVIPHPFDTRSKRDLRDSDLRLASEKLLAYLEKDIGLVQLNGLSLRFFESFAAFMSADRIRKIELINAFSNMIKCFEPYVKKVAAIKTDNLEIAKRSLDQSMISNVIAFTSDIKNSKHDYWATKPIHEACIRLVYPYRHIEAHEARDYTSFDMERVIYYMFASLIFISLDRQLTY